MDPKNHNIGMNARRKNKIEKKTLATNEPTLPSAANEPTLSMDFNKPTLSSASNEPTLPLAAN